MMTQKIVAAGTLIGIAVGLCGLTGCSTIKNGNVELDSSKTVHPKTPDQIKAIQDNPKIPPAIKAQMLGQGGGASATQKGRAGN